MDKQHALENEHTIFPQKQIYLNVEMDRRAKLDVEQVFSLDVINMTILHFDVSIVVYFTEEHTTTPRNRKRTES